MNLRMNLLCTSLFMIIFTVYSSERVSAVTGFSLEKYLGSWYEIARMPFKYEDGLKAVTATYGLNNDGKVTVLNRGIKENGKESNARGIAKFAGPRDIGHLKVSFFLWFYTDYIITDIDSSYQWAMVTSPPNYFWILSRTPRLETAVLKRLLTKAARLGYDTTKVILTPQ